MKKQIIPLLLLTSLHLNTNAQDFKKDLELLPEGEHRDVVGSLCTACHSIKLVVQNKMQRHEWDKTLQWMESKHNLPKYPNELREKILDYLGKVLVPEGKSSIDGALGPRNTNPLP